MVEKIERYETVYKCEICAREYATEAEALKCESQGPSKILFHSGDTVIANITNKGKVVSPMQDPEHVVRYMVKFDETAEMLNGSKLTLDLSDS